MLTSDLLLFRTRLGKIRPTFIEPLKPELASLATDLVAIVEAEVGSTREALEQALEARLASYPRVKVARGVCKLLLDRCTFEEPREEVAAMRLEAFSAASAILRELPPGAGLEDYHLRLEQRLPQPLEVVREALYADLPAQRRLLEWRRLTPRALLDRYNMALAQGLVLHAGSLTVDAQVPELLRVRRLLRWLKFCRLVAEVQRHGLDWSLSIEGPAAILDMQKKYGLQLATFLPAVPLLKHYRISAEIRLARRGTFQLELTEKDPLVSTHDDALGHIPPEVQLVAGKFEGDGNWQLDLTPQPRHVGAQDVCVPDLQFEHRRSGTLVCFELFHRWHHHALERRLASLRAKPDPALYLGVDRSIARRPEIAAALEGFEQVMVFNEFPSEKKIREILARHEP